MTKFDFNPGELTIAVYQLQTAEKKWQEAKDEYEILDDSAKDVLSSIKNKIRALSSCSEVQAESEGRATQDWKNFKAGLYAAKRALGQASLAYNHSRRIVEALTSGMAFKRELLKRGIVEQ